MLAPAARSQDGQQGHEDHGQDRGGADLAQGHVAVGHPQDRGHPVDRLDGDHGVDPEEVPAWVTGCGEHPDPVAEEANGHHGEQPAGPAGCGRQPEQPCRASRIGQECRAEHELEHRDHVQGIRSRGFAAVGVGEPWAGTEVMPRTVGRRPHRLSKSELVSVCEVMAPPPGSPPMDDTWSAQLRRRRHLPRHPRGLGAGREVDHARRSRPPDRLEALRRACRPRSPDISPKTLTDRLRELEAAGVVSRTDVRRDPAPGGVPASPTWAAAWHRSCAPSATSDGRCPRPGRPRAAARSAGRAARRGAGRRPGAPTAAAPLRTRGRRAPGRPPRARCRSTRSTRTSR